ncbi:hypothetical protein D3C72_2001660 [compost metagenome]
MVCAQGARKRKAHVGDVVARARLGEAVEVHADQRRGLEVVRGFFQHLAGAGLDGRFARVQVAGGVVELEAVGGFFLDQQKAAIALDEGGHGDVGFPAVGHGAHYDEGR